MRYLLFLSLFYLCSCSEGNPAAGEKPPATPSSSAGEKNTVNLKENDRIIFFLADPLRDSICLFWKDDAGEKLKTLPNLQDYLRAKNLDLVFAMNAGMYTEDLSPLGLYIEKGKTLRKTNTRTKGYGNFYIQPGGIFYLTEKGEAGIQTVRSFSASGIRFATQSGPMLVVHKKINTEFNPASENRNIRNGVGILPDGRVLLAISSDAVTFHEFASFFQEAGCINALYLDGGISGVVYPEKNISPLFHPGYGVMIGVIRKKD